MERMKRELCKLYWTALLLGLLMLLCFSSNFSAANEATEPPRYYHLPMHEVLQYPIYLHTTAHHEVTVAFAEKGSDLKMGDYLTHADGIRVLNGGLSHFLKSGEKEIIVPVIDDSEEKHGGQKLMGFVMITPVSPRKISTRRGEIYFDFDEGGPAPTLKLGNIVVGSDGAKTTSDPDYSPPPHGGGACITGKDCYYFNGSCTMGQCACMGVHTGSYCQLDRPDFAAMSVRLKANQQYQQKKKEQQQIKEMGMSPFAKKENAPPLTAPPPNSPKTGPPPEDLRAAQELARAKEINDAQTNQGNNDRNNDQNQDQQANEEYLQEGQSEGKKKKKRKKKPAPTTPNTEEQQTKGQESVPPKEERIHEWKAGDKPREPDEAREQQQQPTSNTVTVEDLYGEGKVYPEPYTAGRLPSQTLNERHRRRTNREPFIYSVRFRSAPLGLVFDNKISNATIVEQVVKGQQAQQSDIKEGDRLLAVDQFNVTDAPAKVTMRIMSSLPWPRILVFETRYQGEDPNVVKQKVMSRSFNMTILYPPTLVGEYTFRLGEWSPTINLNQPSSETMIKKLNGRSDFCPIYRIKSLDDPFGCRPPNNVYGLPSSFNEIVLQNGFVKADIEQDSPMLTALMQEAFVRKINIEPRSLAMMKRGECTFVGKAKSLVEGGANLGLVINTDNEIIEMPAGKEKTSDCTVPFGMMKNDEGHFLHMAARANEIWAVVYEQNEQISATCEKTMLLAEDVIDKWPYSVPPLAVQKIVQSKPPDQSRVRGMTEEGGRVALSGENGWAFFDYHLAMFGPQEVPIGPIKLVMAMPPFGCDVAAYTVRITDAVVAILRGGGCSFGIKVINAQKLGAKAVMIVNTDDMKTMRLMALPDEVPLIKIPCIMVSRRIQYYLEEQIRPYYPMDQHVISIQPTGIFGDYEIKNPLELPKRLAT